MNKLLFCVSSIASIALIFTPLYSSLYNATNPSPSNLPPKVNPVALPAYTYTYTAPLAIPHTLLEPECQKMVKDLITQLDLDVDEFFIYGMMYTESRFRHNSTSKAGAKGILQVMPKTQSEMVKYIRENYPSLYAKLGNLNTKSANIIVSMVYIKTLTKNQSEFNPHKLLTAYNRGRAGAERYYAKNNTYVSSYSKSVLNSVRYIKRVSTGKELYNETYTNSSEDSHNQ